MRHFPSFSPIAGPIRPQIRNPRKKPAFFASTILPYDPFLAVSWPFSILIHFHAFLYIFQLIFVIYWQTLLGKCRHIFGRCSKIFRLVVKIYIPGKNPPWLGKNLCGGANTFFRGAPKTFKNSIFGKKCCLISSINSMNLDMKLQSGNSADSRQKKYFGHKMTNGEPKI